MARLAHLARRQRTLHALSHRRAQAPLAVVGDAKDKRGTEVTFLPSTATFTKTEFDFATLEHRLRELAFLNSGVTHRARRQARRREERVVLNYDGGLEAFVRYLDRAKKPLIPNPIMLSATKDSIVVEAALSWNDSYHESMLCFTNNIPQRDGGTHLAGFRAALTRVVTKYADDMGEEGKDRADRRRLPRRPDLRAVGEGARSEILLADQGQAGVVGSAPRGRRRGDREARPLVRGTSRRSARCRWQGDGSGGARSAARKARELTRRKGALDGGSPARQARRLPGARSGEMRAVHRRRR